MPVARTTARAVSTVPSASVTSWGRVDARRLALDQTDRRQLGELRAARRQQVSRRDVVGAEQAADGVRRRVARVPGVDDDDVEAHPSERQRRLQARAAASDHHDVRIHVAHSSHVGRDVASSLAELATDEERIRLRLRALREERGLSLDAVADAAGMAASTLSRLETGKRRLAIDHLAPLARALGTSVDALVAAGEPADPRVRRRARMVEGCACCRSAAATGAGRTPTT